MCIPQSWEPAAVQDVSVMQSFPTTLSNSIQPKNYKDKKYDAISHYYIIEFPQLKKREKNHEQFHAISSYYIIQNIPPQIK